MAKRFENFHKTLCVAVAVQAACAVDGSAAPRVAPSDCKPRHADSTCATVVAGETQPVSVPKNPNPVLYDGVLGGVPNSGYAYWGYDFIANEVGTPSPVRPDEFINRSAVPVTITLSFDIPTTHACGRGCMPRVEFLTGPGWTKLDPAFTTQGNTASITQTFAPGSGYGWVIGLWQASNPRLSVTVPKGSNVALRELGLAAFPAMATELPAVTGTCDCWNGTTAACSEGTHFSNGLLGVWALDFGMYFRAGAFTNCPIDH